MIVLLFAIEFLCGSLMFSYWLGFMANKDITTIGDGNPGGFNLMTAAGPVLGTLGIFLDFMKGYLPLVLFVENGLILNMELLPVAMAPILGHAFSPFVKLKGGKAIAVSFGVWCAISRFELGFAFAILLAIIKVLMLLAKRGKPTTSEEDIFMVVCGLFLLVFYLLLRSYDIVYFYFWFGNLLLLVYKGREKFHKLYRDLHNKMHHEQKY